MLFLNFFHMEKQYLNPVFELPVPAILSPIFYDISIKSLLLY